MHSPLGVVFDRSRLYIYTYLLYVIRGRREFYRVEKYWYYTPTKKKKNLKKSSRTRFIALGPAGPVTIIYRLLFRLVSFFFFFVFPPRLPTDSSSADRLYPRDPRVITIVGRSLDATAFRRKRYANPPDDVDFNAARASRERVVFSDAIRLGSRLALRTRLARP